jgi:hypothetical protein
LPPDERIDAPPPNLAWSESIRADGGRITFDGGRSPVTMGLGAILAVVATSLLILAGIRLHVWPFVLFGSSSCSSSARRGARTGGCPER